MENATLITEIAALVGAASVTPNLNDVVMPANWPAPFGVASPGSPEEVEAVVRAVETAGLALVVSAGGTHLHTGYPPPADRPYLLLSTRRLNRILDYQPDDLTITCEAGVTLAELQRALATKGQFLALDAPLPEQATLGGIVSANTSGLWRPAYGSPRDLLIGLFAVMTEGVRVKGGGKVVKNVAGYDVCKLFTGAWGTVGVITELTFKVRPSPESEAVWSWAAPDLAAAARLGLTLHLAQLSPTFLLATNELDAAPCLVVGLQGTASRVVWQGEEFARRAVEAGLAAPRPVSADELTALRNRQARNTPDTPFAARIACLPTDVAPLTERLQGLPGLSATAHVETGLVSVAAPSGSAALIESITKALPAKANLLWQRVDDSTLAANLPMWGETREDFLLQRALKAALDPRQTFSPGRFLGRI